MRRPYLLVLLLALTAGCLGDELDPDDDPPGDVDCDDPDRPPSFEWRVMIRDVDGDRYGEGETARMCLRLGHWLADWVPGGGPIDCAPTDGTRWLLLPYAGRDADLDGAPIAEAGELCTGDQLPPDYLAAIGDDLFDCDDGDPDAWAVMSLFDDRDQDGFGSGDLQSVCVGRDVPADWAAIDGDCAPDDRAAWMEHSYEFRDVDQDSYTIPENGTVCGGWDLPRGYLNGSRGPDCDDRDAFRFQIWRVFADVDRDGIGAGEEELRCDGWRAPDRTAAVGGDCAAEDPTRWRELAYTFRDADLDFFLVPEAGRICSGFLRPRGYYDFPGLEADCDDSDAARFLAMSGYPDVDGDGRGAGDLQTYCTDGELPPGAVTTPGDCAPDDAALHTPLVSFADDDGDGIGAGSSQTLCTAGTRPPGFVAAGGDCAPADGAAWRFLAYAFVDRDGDGRTAAEAGQLCAGAALPPPYRADPAENDCDDGDPALLSWAVLYEDGDRDGVGAGERVLLCLGQSAPIELSVYGDDADDGDPLIQTDQDDDDELEQILL